MTNTILAKLKSIQSSLQTSDNSHHQLSDGAYVDWRTAMLTVRICCEDGARQPTENFDNTLVMRHILNGKRQTRTQACDMPCVFTDLAAGTYEVAAKPNGPTEYALAHPVVVTLKAGEQATVTLKLKHARVETVTPNQPHKQFVNLPAQQETPVYGRQLTVTATLQHKTPGVPVYFVLEPSANNTKDLPQADRAMMPQQAITDENGCATTQLTVSTCGGDQVKVLAGVCAQPAHECSDAIASAPISVWRRLWCRLTYPEGAAEPEIAASVDAWRRVYVELVLAASTRYSKKSCPTKTFYKEWMLKLAGGEHEVAVIGAHNQKHFHRYAQEEAGQPLFAHIIASHYQLEAVIDQGGGQKWAATPLLTFVMSAGKAQQITLPNPGGNSVIVLPALSGQLVDVGVWRAMHDPNVQGEISDLHIHIEHPRNSLTEVTLNLPLEAPMPTPEQPIVVQLSMTYAKATQLDNIASHRYCAYTGSDRAQFNDAVTQRIAQALNQTPKPGKQPQGMRDHPHQYDDTQGGRGSHCCTSFEDRPGNLKPVAVGGVTRDGKEIEAVYTEGLCVMSHIGSTTGALHHFCSVCAPYLKRQDMSKWC